MWKIEASTALLIVVLIFFAATAKCEVPSQPIPAPAPASVPWWAPLAGLGLSAGLLGLKQIAPKIPGYLIPFVNLGLALGVSWLGGHGVSLTDPNLYGSAGVMAATSFAVHSVVKNVARGDSFGQSSEPVR